ncbi:MAG: DUF3604 domain-containing protein [Acidobacteriota bacterium]
MHRPARARASSRCSLGLLALVLPLAWACGAGERSTDADGGPVDGSLGSVAASTDPLRRTHPEIVDGLRADRDAVRHPSDGAGRVWLVASNDGVSDGEGASDTTSDGAAARAGTPGRWTLVFAAGPRGVAVGGAVFLQVSPFWGWSSPQVRAPSAPGYTRVTTDAEGVTLDLAVLDQGLLAARIGGRALAAGETLRFVYGAGAAGAVADRYAERGERFWVAVDGDGDGVRGVLESSPRLDVAPGPPARLVAFVPSTARPGETLRARLSLLDLGGSALFGAAALGSGVDSIALPLQLRLERLDSAADGDAWREAPSGMPAEVRLDAEGLASVDFTVDVPGIFRLHALSGDRRPAFEAVSNPLLVAPAPRRIVWGDLQNHSNASDGTGRPEDLLRYARDVAALDVMALTDHDHWGMLFLARHPALWRALQETTERFHDPGRFVTVRGYEWTSWLYGHRHVLFWDPYGPTVDEPIFSSVDEATDHPRELWDALAALGPARRILTIAHHRAGGPIAIDWSIAPDPRFEPVTELVSVHGSSEAADSPHRIYRAVPGHFVRDALARGYRLGLLGSSDGHDGHPGLGHLGPGVSGLAGIHAEELTRPAVYDALRARDVYATSGTRIILRAVYGGWAMGSEVPVVDGAALSAAGGVDAIPAGHLFVQVVGTAPVERLDVVRLGAASADGAASTEILPVDCARRIQCRALVPLEPPASGDVVYVRAVQVDDHAAWSSPFFFVEP